MKPILAVLAALLAPGSALAGPLCGQTTIQQVVDALRRRDLATLSRPAPAVETRHHRTPLDRFKLEQLRRTLCLHRGAPRIVEISVLHNDSQILSPDAPTAYEKSRLTATEKDGNGLLYGSLLYWL